MRLWTSLSEFMSKFFFSYSRGSKSSNYNSTNGPTKFQRAKTGGLVSKGTLLVNDTSNTLYLRDKVGAAYGGTRYKIPGKSCIEVFPLQHTFFTMIAYAVERDVEEMDTQLSPNSHHSSSNVSSNDNNRNKKKSTDTNLSLDSDQLADNKKITITLRGSKYDIELSPR
ncbi:hypothetical protein GOP47_0011233 [Adiantum capillus-veneris]|uniref:Uncharacterized protein n=1 Tax=Adiantum capillus-veneris TaxID=13818 RepID=A0A9D4USS7_ADICA|nr:hypothetical protein GOP47_0011233 [Adiantum capillus-veneris]